MGYPSSSPSKALPNHPVAHLELDVLILQRLDVEAVVGFDGLYDGLIRFDHHRSKGVPSRGFVLHSMRQTHPMVGTVCRISSESFCSLFRIVVLPALSRPGTSCGSWGVLKGSCTLFHLRLDGSARPVPPKHLPRIRMRHSLDPKRVDREWNRREKRSPLGDVIG